VAMRDTKLHGQPQALLPSISFECPMLYSVEDQGWMSVRVVRLGDISYRSVVDYETRDISAKAGYKYEAVSGCLVFESGEREKAIAIRLLDHPTWDATVEFEVVLKQEGIVNATLTGFGKVCRVKIMDQDPFPTNRFKDQIQERKFEELGYLKLLWEYCKMNLLDPVVRQGVLKNFLIDLFANLYFIMELFLDLYLIDQTLCATCDPEGAGAKLTMICILRLLPCPLMHYFEYRKAYWKVGGTSRLLIQSNLLRKYLSYDERSLLEVSESSLILALTRDTSLLVEKGFGSLAKMVSDSTRGILIVLYQLIIPFVIGAGDEDMSLVIFQRVLPLFLYPMAIFPFLAVRDKLTRAVIKNEHIAQNAMIEQARVTVASFPLIQDYKKRGIFVDKFCRSIGEFNKANAANSGMLVNTKRYTWWWTQMINIVYIAVGGMQVASKSLPLGSFLNNIRAFNALGGIWSSLYEVILDMLSVLNSLETIVILMNLATDVEHRKFQCQRNLELCRAEKELILNTNDEYPDLDPLDKLCVEMRSLSFRYGFQAHADFEIKSSTVCLPQGALYTFIGPPSQGKGTILKLFGEVLLPFIEGYEHNIARGSGDVLVPPHLTVLHVSKDPLFIHDTLYKNLIFGCARHSGNDDMDRVLGICRRLGLPKHILETIETNTAPVAWLNVLSSTEASLLHVARALIANPEILIIHKPTLFLNTELSDTMYTLLKEFVEHRGLFKDPKEFYVRRPRTCLVTARRIAGTGAQVADAVFQMSQDFGLEYMPAEAQEQDMEEAAEELVSLYRTPGQDIKLSIVPG